MPRRSRVSLAEVTDLHTLATAFGQAARGKRQRPDVQAFAADLDRKLSTLGDDVRAGRAPYGRWTELRVFDPKPRRILAPCFPDRVLHHALMAHLGPVLDRALVDDTFACRTGKGTLAAVLRAQAHGRRFPWFVKADVRAFFASVDHARLLALLGRRFKDAGVLALCRRILDRTPDPPGRGLPIGALTSQHFANAYLDALDRFLLEALHVRALVRYMDDVVWFCDTRPAAQDSLTRASAFLAETRGLELKPSACIGRSEAGFAFLGFVVRPGSLRLSLRRKRRYIQARRTAEAAYQAGLLDAPGLQARYDAALAITAHAEARGFRAADLARHPAVDP